MAFPSIFDNYVHQEGVSGRDGSEALWRHKEMLVSAGWAVQASSDGTTYSGADDLITQGQSGANGMENDLAWFRLASPDGAREFTAQTVSASAQTFRVKYTVGDTFTIGGSITETPSASDEYIIKGGGTDASPTGTAWHHTGNGSDGSDFFVGVAETVYPYRFYGCTLDNAYPQSSGSLWAFDAVDTPTGDTDPFVVLIGTAGVNGQWARGTMDTVAGSTDCWAMFDHGGGSETLQRVALQLYTDSGDVNDNVNSKRDLAPLLWAREDARADPDGVKGWSTLLLHMLQVNTLPRTEQFTVGSETRKYLRRQDFALPWAKYPMQWKNILVGTLPTPEPSRAHMPASPKKTNLLW